MARKSTKKRKELVAAMQTPPHIAFVIITTALHTQHTDRLRKQLQKAKIPNCTVYVVENKIGVDGYAKGVNRGMKEALQAGVEIIFLANPDIDIASLLTQPFLEAADHFDVWGYAMHQDETTYFGGEIDAWRLSGGLIAQPSTSRFAPCHFVSGSLMAVNAAAAKRIGWFDERYGMYYEDVDYCQRASDLHFRVGIDSDLTYTHFEQSARHTSQDVGYEKKALLQASHLRFFLQYASVHNVIYEILRYPITFFSEPIYALLLREFVMSLIKKTVHKYANRT
jgi:GT2 family glycosyltransferase